MNKGGRFNIITSYFCRHIITNYKLNREIKFYINNHKKFNFIIRKNDKQNKVIFKSLRC